MSETCVFHPSEPSRWLCPACNEAFCQQCVLKKGGGATGGQVNHFCPKCHGRAEWVGAANLLPPFWERLHYFFVYPLRSRPLLLMAITAAVMLTLGRVPILGLFVQLAGGFIMLRYAYEILKQTAKGKLLPPKVDLQALSKDIGPVLKQYLMFILLGVLGALIAVATGPLVLAYVVFILLFAPAMLIVLVLTSSLFKALNPAVFVSLAWRIGPAYLLMYLFLILLAAAPGVLGRFLAGFLPGPLVLYLLFLAQYYYMFVSFHLIGYVLLQYHTEIGYEVSYEDFQDASGGKAEKAAGDQLWNDRQHVDSLVQQGELDKALDFLGRRFESGGITDSALARKYYELLGLRQAGSRSAAGRLLIGRLLAENRRQEAVRVFEEGLSEDQEFLPEAGDLFELAETLEDTGRPKAAIKAFQIFCRRYSGHAKAAEACFRIALILNDRLLMPEKAARVLQSLKSKYPEHPILDKVENYLNYSLSG